MIIGIDEVGRGAWAGPVVVAAAALGGATIEGLTDSKKLSKKKREAYSLQIKQLAPLIGIGWVSAHDIDLIGIGEALKLAARRALAQCDLRSIEQIIIDGTIRLIDDPRVVTMKQADLLVPSVSAASVIAKVARDHYMSLCDEVFPGYEWASNVGYGAAAHHEAIKRLGVTPLHRMSFAPMKEMRGLTGRRGGNNPVDSRHVAGEITSLSGSESITFALAEPSQEALSSAPGLIKGLFPPRRPAAHTKVRGALGVREAPTSIGNRAEDEAANYLQHQGYEVVDRNWKTKWCEIDIIAMKRQVMYFVEVKYRKSSRQGGGIAAITPRKLNQMQFAAKLWLHQHGEIDARLSVVEVTGESFEVTQLIESV